MQIFILVFNFKRLNFKFIVSGVISYCPPQFFRIILGADPCSSSRLRVFAALCDESFIFGDAADNSPWRNPKNQRFEISAREEERS
jgi:hypothetical protein